MARSRKKGLVGASSATAIYNKAFDRYLISFDADFSLVLSPKIKQQAEAIRVKQNFLEHEGKALNLPCRFLPDLVALTEHRSTMQIRHNN